MYCNLFCFSQNCLLAYRQFVHWANQGRWMGLGVGVVLPACIVQLIRKKITGETGQYTGFREVTEVDELLKPDLFYFTSKYYYRSYCLSKWD